MDAEDTIGTYWDLTTQTFADSYPEETRTKFTKYLNALPTAEAVLSSVIVANASCQTTSNVSDSVIFNASYAGAIHQNATSSGKDSETAIGVIPILIMCLVSCISLATVFGNIAIIVCVARTSGLRTVYNIYAASLAFADLLVGVVVMTCMSVYTYFRLWPLGSDFCTVWVLFDFTCCTTSMLHLDAIAFDRYKSVTSPLLYRTTVTKSRAVKISLLMWLLGSFLWVPSIFYFRLTKKQMGIIVEDDCYFTADKYFVVGQVIVVYYIPVVFMVIVYIMLFVTLKKRQPQAKKITKSHERCSSVFSIDGKVRKDKSSSSSEIYVHFDNKLSNPGEIGEAAKKIPNSVNKNPKPVSAQGKENAKISSQNKRCIRTLGATIAVFLFCWLPFITLWPVAAFSETNIPADLYKASYWLAYLNSFVNPYIYFVLNRDFRHAFKKTFCRQE